MRLELKYVGELLAVHCYGQGVAGWTLAPAVAEEAAGLLANAAWARKVGRRAHPGRPGVSRGGVVIGILKKTR